MVDMVAVAVRWMPPVVSMEINHGPASFSDADFAGCQR